MSGLVDARMAAARHDDARSGKLRSLGQGAVSGSLDREELAFRADRGEGAAGLVTGVEEPERHRDDVGFELHQTREGLPDQGVLREIDRKSVVLGKSVSVREDLGVRLNNKKKKST